MVTAKKKTSTKTSKQAKISKSGSRAHTKTARSANTAKGITCAKDSNLFFVISMSVLAGVLLFANLFMIIY